MERIKKYKADIICVMSLLILFCFLSCLYWGKMGDIIVDGGREAYFPLAILKGNVQYKDIFNIFSPLSYQLNAFLFLLFGTKLNTLYIAGCINSLIILITLYLISRSITAKSVSWITCFIVIVACMFNPYIFNYIFPYAYAIVYALSAFLLSVLFGIYYLKSSNPKFVPISFFFLGLSLAFKYEFIFFLILLICTIKFFKPISQKYSYISFAAFLSMPVISYSVTFSRGLTISELINHLLIMQNFISAKSYKILLANLGCYYPNINIFFSKLIFSALSFLIFSGLILFFYFSQKLVSYCFNKWVKPEFSNQKIYLQLTQNILIFIQIFLIILLTNMIIVMYNFILPKIILLGITTYLTIVAAFVILLLLVKHHARKNIDKIFLFIALAAVIGSVKSLVLVSLNTYGSFLAPLLLLVGIVFLIDYIPNFLRFLNREMYKYACVSVLLIVGLNYLACESYVYHLKKYPIKTSMGIRYSRINRAKVINKTVKYIKNNTPKNATILVIPEGVIINFLTGRPSNTKYYCLIPNHIETFGEENIINDLSKNLPEYIIINNRASPSYGASFFGIDYGFKINIFVQENYDLVKTIKSSIRVSPNNPESVMFIYKKHQTKR